MRPVGPAPTIRTSASIRELLQSGKAPITGKSCSSLPQSASGHKQSVVDISGNEKIQVTRNSQNSDVTAVRIAIHHRGYLDYFSRMFIFRLTCWKKKMPQQYVPIRHQPGER
jgi:hypothetical protein